MDIPNQIFHQQGSNDSSIGSAKSQQPPLRSNSPEFHHPSPELPTWFSKCMRLLTFPSEEAREELEKLFDDAVERKERSDGSSSVGSVSKKPETQKPVAHSQQSRLAMIAARNAAKTQALKSAAAAASTSAPTEPPAKKPKTSSSPRRIERVGSPEILPPSGSESTQIGDSSSITGEMEETTDLADLLSGDSCTVCGSFSQTAGNSLLDCADCRKMFHQLCHKPPATSVDPQDPRLVWYCDSCTKRLKKISERSEPSIAFKSQTAPSPPKTKPSSSTHAAAPTSSNEAPQLFKRVQSTPASKTTVIAPGVGLAKLAAGFQNVKGSKEDKSDSKRVKLIEHPPKAHNTKKGA